MNKICVLIRVFNRTKDLKYCIDIIRDTWKSNNYFIIVVFNGREDGYSIDDSSFNKIDLLLEIKNNIGHFSGNSQLLLEGLSYIPKDCEYTLILEADTWMHGDELINKYIKKLKDKNAVWASAQFFRYVKNLATDFAIINNEFLKTHREIFIFSGTPEYYVANYLDDRGLKYLYITENMPINLPKYIRKYPYAPVGRFFSFEKSKMVTHHIEVIDGGMNQKKLDFNMVSNTNYFEVENNISNQSSLFGLRLFKALSLFIPYKGWFIKKKSSDLM